MIDDNEAMLHVMGRMLNRHGYTVTAARNGQEAIEKIAVKTFDLALIDLHLPDIDGLELHKLMSVRSPKTKKILLTGLPPEKSELDSFKEPVVVLVKPIAAEQLIEAIADMLK